MIAFRLPLAALRRSAPVLAIMAAVLLPAFPVAAAPSVVVSIPPIHSLAAGVMAGIGNPVLLVPGGRSPHDYAMRPSEARALESADIVAWIGPGLESFLEKPLATLAAGKRIVRLERAAGLERLRVREGGVWTADHDAHDHGKKDDHAHGHDHGRMPYDSHIWLSPANARAIVAALTEALTAHDPANGARYRANAAALVQRIGALDVELSQALTPVKGVRYLVFHDAYQYFERHFGLSPAGSITAGPERSPSARRLSEMRRAIQRRGARCVFREPQFAPKLVETITAGTMAKSGVLDPLGAGLPPGPELWFTLMRDLGRSLTSCLSGQA